MTNELEAVELEAAEPETQVFNGYTSKITLANGSEILANIVSSTADSLTLDSELGTLTVQKANVRVEAYSDASLDALGTLKMRDQLGMIAVYVKSGQNQWRLIWQKEADIYPSEILTDAYMSAATAITYAELERLYDE